MWKIYLQHYCNQQHTYWWPNDMRNPDICGHGIALKQSFIWYGLGDSDRSGCVFCHNARGQKNLQVQWWNSPWYISRCYFAPMKRTFVTPNILQGTVVYMLRCLGTNSVVSNFKDSTVCSSAFFRLTTKHIRAANYWPSMGRRVSVCFPM